MHIHLQTDLTSVHVDIVHLTVRSRVGVAVVQHFCIAHISIHFFATYFETKCYCHSLTYNLSTLEVLESNKVYAIS
jgi:hypothetical protein